MLFAIIISVGPSISLRGAEQPVNWGRVAGAELPRGRQPRTPT